MKRIVITGAFLALLSVGAAFAAAPEAVKAAAKACCEAMEKCCCCDKDKADKAPTPEKHDH